MTLEQWPQELRWALRVRWIIVLFVASTAAVAGGVGGLPVPYLPGAFVLALAVAFNVGGHLLLDRFGAAGRRSIFAPGERGDPEWAQDVDNIFSSSPEGDAPPAELRLVRYLQVPFDALFLTLIVHYSGGANSPYVALYFLAVLANAIRLSSSLTYLLAGLLAVLYAGLLVVEGVKESALPSFFGPGPGAEAGTRFASFAIVAALLFATAYFASRMAGLLRRQIVESERHADELAALNAVVTATSESLSLHDTLSAGLDKLLEVMAMDAGAVYLVKKGEENMALAVHRGLDEGTVARQERVPLGEGYAGLAALSGETLYSNDTRRVPDTSPDLTTGEGLLSIASLPLKAKEQVVGVLYLGGRKPQAFSLEDLKLLEAIASQLGVAIENARLYGEVEQLAITDSLTGLANNRVFREQLERELRLARRLGLPVSLLIADIDHFKRFNDSYGHLVGDRVLREVAGLIRQAVRASDLTARYGGEEFVVILPDTQADGGLVLSERVRSAIEAHELGLPGTSQRARLTISLGVATFPYHASSSEELIAAADAALYVSKKRGRNRSTVFQGEEAKQA